MEIEIPDYASTANYFFITIIYQGDYSIENTTITSNTQIRVLTGMTIFLERILPYILIGVGSTVGALLAYQYGIKRPRQRKKQKLIREINKKYNAILNLQHLIIIHKESGGSIYNYSFREREFDPDLISGFLSAISNFQVSTRINGKKGKKKDEGPEEFELSYSNFIILLLSGVYVQVALILDRKPSDDTRDTLNEFIKVLEFQHEKYLKNYTGNIKHFRNTDQLIEQFFEISILKPHYVDMKRVKQISKELSGLETSFITIALTFQEVHTYFMFRELIDSVVEARYESRETIIAAFDQLRRREILKVFAKMTVKEKNGRIEQLEEDKSIEKASRDKGKPMIILENGDERQKVPAPNLDEDFEIVSPSDDIKDKIKKIFGD